MKTKVTPIVKEMTVVELLQKKFHEQAKGGTTVTDWMNATKVDLSLQACTAILLRGREMGLVAMLTLGAALDCTAEELQWIARQKGDKALWRLFSKNQVTAEEEDLLSGYRLLNGEQRAIIQSMMKGLHK